MKRSTRAHQVPLPRPPAVFAIGATVAVVASAAMLTFSGFALAAEEHRELGPHQHGHGKVTIAVEGNTVAIELDAPGMDIVGFEHAAQSDADKQAVDAAKAKLADPLVVLGVPAAAKCKVESANVAFGQHAGHDGDDDDDEKKGADANGGSESRGDKADAHGHNDHAKEAHDDEKHDKDHAHEHGHSEVKASYTLACGAPEALTSLGFSYFEMFAGAEELDVGVVTEKSQRTFEVTRAKPKIALDGMM